jgi:hypothetical protein
LIEIGGLIEREREREREKEKERKREKETTTSDDLLQKTLTGRKPPPPVCVSFLFPVCLCLDYDSPTLPAVC